MPDKSDRESYIELFEGVMNGLAGLGLVTFVVFPLAIPVIALTALLAIPVVIGGVLVAVLAAPVLIVRRLVRTRGEARLSSTRRDAGRAVVRVHDPAGQRLRPAYAYRAGRSGRRARAGGPGRSTGGRAS